MVVQLSEPQWRLMESTAPTAILQGGGGCGKTYVEAGIVMLFAEQYPGSRGAFLAPTHPQLKQAFVPHLLSYLTQSGMYAKIQWHRADNIITWHNGTTVFLRSVQEPEAILGLDLAWAVCDELGLWHERAWDYLQTRMRQPGYPHRIRGGYTPKGVAHWTALRLVPSENIEIIRASLLDNPSITRDVIDRLRSEYGEGSDLWRQEVLGEFVAWSGLIYPLREDVHAVAPPHLTDGIQCYTNVVAGVDWGWENPGAIVYVGVDHNDVAWVFDEVVAEHQPVQEYWVTHALDGQQRYRVSSFACDPSSPENIEAFRRAGIRARAAQNRVLPGIQAVAARFATDRIRISPDCVHTLSEMRTYSWRQRGDGTMVPDEPQKSRDHAMDALRYAMMELSRPRALVAWRTRQQSRRRAS